MEIIETFDGKLKIMANYYSEGKAWDTSGEEYGSNIWCRPTD